MAGKQKRAQKNITVSVVIPCFNERATILKLLSEIKQINLGLKKEIIIVDDNSFDGSKEILKILSKSNKYKILFNKRNYGKGYSVMNGIKNSSGNIIIIQDADLEYSPKDYKALLMPILRENSSVVYGSRNLKKTNKRHSTTYFYLGGVFLSMLANVLYGSRLTDITTGYKVFKKEIFSEIRIKSKGFEFCDEVTAKILKRNITITEVPITYKPRGRDEGKKISWRDGFWAILALFKYRFVD